MPQIVKNPPVMWETQVLSLGQEDPLEKSMATHSSILVWKSHGLGARCWEDLLEKEMATHSSILPGKSHGLGARWATIQGLGKESDRA